MHLFCVFQEIQLYSHYFNKIVINLSVLNELVIFSFITIISDFHVTCSSFCFANHNLMQVLWFTEAIVKIIGLRHHYFTVPWNLFDFILVFASIMGILLQDVLTNFPISPTLLRVVRVFRIGRILRLIKVFHIPYFYTMHLLIEPRMMYYNPASLLWWMVAPLE